MEDITSVAGLLLLLLKILQVSDCLTVSCVPNGMNKNLNLKCQKTFAQYCRNANTLICFITKNGL